MKRRIATALLLLTAASGCGGNDPLNVFGKGDGPPTVQLPFAGPINTFVGATRSIPYFQLRPATTGISLVAPVDGLITNIDIDVSLGTGLFSVTILCNTHYSIQVAKMAGTVRRVGDYVTAGAPIGTASTTDPTLGVLLDGVNICPYSYLVSESRDRVNNPQVANTVKPCLEQ